MTHTQLDNKPITLSIVVPVYKSGATVRPLLESIEFALSTFEGNFEVVFVDDFSPDDSWLSVLEATAAKKNVRGIRLSRNFGQHYAITAGLSFCKGDWIVTMDCDLQDDPKCLPKLLETAKSGYDVVLVRRINRDDGIWNNLTSLLFYRFFDLMAGVKTDPTVGAFRIMSRRVVEQYCSLPEKYRFFGGLIQWMGFPTAYIDYERKKRLAGKSSYTFTKRLALGIDAALSFTDRPLKIMVTLGLLTSALSLAYALAIIYWRITGQIAEIGFASTIVSLYLLGGLLLTSIGLVGVYVGRIYTEVKARPCFIIAEDTNARQSP